MQINPEVYREAAEAIAQQTPLIGTSGCCKAISGVSEHLAPSGELPSIYGTQHLMAFNDLFEGQNRPAAWYFGPCRSTEDDDMIDASIKEWTGVATIEEATAHRVIALLLMAEIAADL